AGGGILRVDQVVDVATHVGHIAGAHERLGGRRCGTGENAPAAALLRFAAVAGTIHSPDLGAYPSRDGSAPAASVRSTSALSAATRPSSSAGCGRTLRASDSPSNRWMAVNSSVSKTWGGSAAAP